MNGPFEEWYSHPPIGMSAAEVEGNPVKARIARLEQRLEAVEAERDEAMEDFERVRDERDIETAENEELRAALRQIAGDEWPEVRGHAMVKIARSALGGDGE